MSSILQVVDGDAEFNAAGVDSFVKSSGVESAGVGYTVVAIMGPQSSGKSTLLNHLVRARNTPGTPALHPGRALPHCFCHTLLLHGRNLPPRAHFPIPPLHALCSLAPTSRRWTP